ncbi:hypothetical protein AN641_04460 [Candidatus Epulonipiscioides gigas]|nr:hypothetical protein AN641_04460 [Epulopiscium sp. SCG-C07WGA-EpuloA2]
MYAYDWDEETGGLLLNSSPLSFSKEPRPVYYKELDILGFDEFFEYEKDETYPYMWAEQSNYWYRGRNIAKTKGGSLYTKPEIIILEEINEPLKFINIKKMVEKNQELIEKLSSDTIKRVYNTFIKYQNKIDIFYVAFSGGKDSIVTLDIVQRALPHNQFKVIFGDTGMEFPDTYDTVNIIEKECQEKNIEFLRASSHLKPEESWQMFGPPAQSIRWCCSVHKTAPQISLLQNHLNISKFTGMAFTGIRRDESYNRSQYDDVSHGQKHYGQYSSHVILNWNSVELYMYIYLYKLYLNTSYKKGSSRAGCLVCPMSSGKHEYMKYINYKNETSVFLDIIKNTSSKTSFNAQEMNEFINNGYWKKRKSGRELNFSTDNFLIEKDKYYYSIRLFSDNNLWKKWINTIGKIISINLEKCIIEFKNIVYEIKICKNENETVFIFLNDIKTKDAIKFASLFRSCLIKSLYCNQCGVCTVECPHNCIKMEKNSPLSISTDCKRCLKCHDIYGHCLRYNSVKNKLEGEIMKEKLDRYFSFGIRKEWLKTFFEMKGEEKFWISDGNGVVSNKKKEAFRNFILDAGLIQLKNDKSKRDKYLKYEPTKLCTELFEIGIDSQTTWSILLCNLVYTPQFRWFIKNVSFNENITLDNIKVMLEEYMPNDIKGYGKRNIADAFKFILITTPLGQKIGLGNCDFQEIINKNGDLSVKLNYFQRTPWPEPDPIVILYSLYKFAEHCGDYYQFTLTRLLNHNIESDGISPTEIFGLDRKQMEAILTGLSINYPEFINATFTLGLDNIVLRLEQSSDKVLENYVKSFRRR